MAGQLQGKRAFITGSFQGVGLGIATVFAREGAALVLHGLGEQSVIDSAVAQVKSAGSPKVETYVSDLRDVSATENLVKEILRNGEIDILDINPTSIHQTTPLYIGSANMVDRIEKS